jgi:hypothetical protein
MKFLLQFDLVHNRIDLQRLTAHILTALVGVGWAIQGSFTVRQFIQRVAAVGVFLLLLRMILSRVGASRLSAFLALIFVLVVIQEFSFRGVMLLDLVALTVLLAQEYFVLRTKLVAVAAAGAAGILAAGAGENADRLLLIFVSVLFARLLWHAVIERMGRKQFVLFCLKVMLMAIIAPVTYYVIRHFTSINFGAAIHLPSLHVPWWLLSIAGLIVLRGAWATLLLKTDRSPKQRGMRIFYVFFGVALLAVVAGMRRYGDHIFLPQAFNSITRWGLADFNVVVCAYAITATGLLLTAGIDRSLYQDTALARLVRAKLAGSSTKKMRSGKKNP